LAHLPLERSGGPSIKEMIMSKLFASVVLAAALFASASQAMAQPAGWTDMSKPYGGHAANSQEGQRAFWDYQSGQHD
jgi:hypothetical protein